MEIICNNSPEIWQRLETRYNNIRKLFILYQKKHKKNIQHPSEVKLANKIKRNDPCLCGSGKKYKKCCLIKIESNIYDPITGSKFNL
ncbi:SEC-C domain-containing protein [Endozoicomonas sp. SM1973]|uniref:SEC-C domain-containing protein n=2 Tax=Spartinivicinus marinus TaxID=2994442 RepID=A0A853I9Q6_9GAMM|nr:SEC-C domain-containing protein [Spartinivicinus marinus]